MHSFGRWWAVAVCCVLFAIAGCATILPFTTPTPTAKFVYIGNQGASISGYSVNTSTGALTTLKGFPFTVGVNPTALAVDPRSRFLLVGDISASELHVFTIDNSTGALSETAASPYATVREPVAITIDPAGTHVYVASMGSNSVGGYNLSATGELTPIAGSPFATSGTQSFGFDIVINSAGTFVYVKDLTNIYTYNVDAKSGALALVQTIAGPPNLGGIALDPHGIYLYAVASGANSILSYSINAATGFLTPATSSSMVEPNGAYTIAVSPSGEFAYTIENGSDLVSYALSNGEFKPTGIVYGHVYGQRIGIDPTGSFVYVPQACSNCPSGVYNVVNEFYMDSAGALTQIPGSPVAAGTTPWGIAFTTQQ